ncbi:CocE/NonD family hydrolase C-terminal non-catalytic domain-containing protein [Streptomyces sp. NPDC005134]|uniref:CocE/NonD family hydrolase C-terminal non-catalytic domain-containing protein n=1 Tax=Streptomyces sp. NPDC005098 TaxID=3154560 RepID=UPI0033B738DD
MLCWSTGLFEEPTELIGTGVAHLFAETDQEDTNFILRLWDETPGGARQLITSGYLKASHASSTRSAHRGEPLPPAHPHGARGAREDRGVRAAALPVRSHLPARSPPGGGVSNDEPLADVYNALLPPDAFHLPVGRPVTHKIYRDTAHPSRLVLPFTRVTATDATRSGSARDHEGDQLSGS